MLEKDFVPYEPSLALRELGFDEPCFGYYEPNKVFNYINWEIFKDFPYLAKNSEWQDLCGAPTYSQAFRWFRDKYKIHSVINLTIIGTWYFELYDLNDKRNAEIKTNQNEFKTPEEAELACLIKLIEIVKEKK
jgi:hypothetical protein